MTACVRNTHHHGLSPKCFYDVDVFKFVRWNAIHTLSRESDMDNDTNVSDAVLWRVEACKLRKQLEIVQTENRFLKSSLGKSDDSDRAHIHLKIKVVFYDELVRWDS